MAFLDAPSRETFSHTNEKGTDIDQLYRDLVWSTKL